MRFGLTLMLTDQSISVVDAARGAEERGFESLWLGEHTHLPVATTARYATGKYAVGKKTRDGHVPEFYKRTPDPYVMLAAAAAVTTDLRVGTCIALPAEHNPLELAKSVATIDQISDGRFEFGIGAGWNPLELENNGVDPAKRRSVMREKILAMKAIWENETASFDGEHVRFTESWSWPKPVQRPHPPILLGAAASDRNVADMAEWADGWLPVRVFVEGDDLGPHVDKVRARASEIGRDLEDFQVTVLDPRGSTTGRRSREAFEGCLPEVAALASYRDQGARRFNFGAPVHDLGEYEWALDRLAAHVAELDG